MGSAGRMVAVTGRLGEVHQRRDLGRGQAFKPLLNELRLAEEFFVAGIVMSHVACMTLVRLGLR